MYVLVGKKPIKEYFHEQSNFVEGREGSEYTVRLRNGTSTRALYVLSVDGLSVLDGQECSDNSPGYVIGAGETLDVLCYKVDDGTGAKFVFGTKDESYSAEIGKGTDNVGVIAARVFREKQRSAYVIDPGWSYPEWRVQPRKYKGIPTPHEWTMGKHRFGTAGMMSSNTIRAASSRSYSDDADIGQLRQTAGIAPSYTSCSTGSTEVKTGGGIIEPQSLVADDMEETKLGTVFGESVKWNTHSVQFERASTLPDASLVVYYDTKKNLERRGIKFRKEIAALPDPFPGNQGCPTPKHWRK